MLIAVCGATGKVGSGVVDLARRTGVDVRAVAEPGSVNPWPDLPAGAWREAAFDDVPALRGAFEGADAVLLLTPPDPRQVWWQRNIIDAAMDSRVGNVVKVSAFASREGSPTNMGRWHFDGELALLESGLRHTVVRPQYFMDNFLASAPSVRESGILRGRLPADRPYSMIDVRDVSAVCFELLVRDHSPERIVVPTGPVAITPVEIAASLSAALGRPVDYVGLDSAEARQDAVRTGIPRWLIEDSLRMIDDCGPETTRAVEELTGRAAFTIDDFVAARRSLFD